MYNVGKFNTYFPITNLYFYNLFLYIIPFLFNLTFYFIDYFTEEVGLVWIKVSECSLKQY